MAGRERDKNRCRIYAIFLVKYIEEYLVLWRWTGKYFNEDVERVYDSMEDVLTNVDDPNIVLEIMTTRQVQWKIENTFADFISCFHIKAFKAKIDDLRYFIENEFCQLSSTRIWLLPSDEHLLFTFISILSKG